MKPCFYHDLLGLPGQGIHKYRLFDIAIVDTLVIVFLAAFIAWFFEIPFWSIFLALIIIGIITHRIFCVRTTIDKFLFPHGNIIMLR